jgi:hypothetical protein
MQMAAAGTVQVPPTITLNSSGSVVSSTISGDVYTFPFGGDIPAGSFVVITVTARSGGNSVTGSWSSIVDSAGNTFSEVIDATQDNNFTFSAIYAGVLGASVTSSTNISATSSQSNGSSSYAVAKHHSIFVLTGVTQADNTSSAPTTASTNVFSNSATTTTGNGIALHVISSGSAARTISSVSPDFTPLALTQSGCSQYSARKVIDQSGGTAVSSTITLSGTLGRAADIIATFK